MKKDVYKEPNYTIEVVKPNAVRLEKEKFKVDDISIVAKLRKDGNTVTIIDSRRDRIMFSGKYASTYRLDW